jgi:hypothetical protein
MHIMLSRCLLLILVACVESKATPAPAPAPAPTPAPEPELIPPRNFVCERIKILNEKAECVPELSAGDGAVHRARVTVDKTVLSCGIGIGQLEAACTDKIMVWTDPKPESSDVPKKAKPAVKPKTEPTKGRP